MLCVLKLAGSGWVHYFHHYLHQGVTALVTVQLISSVICWSTCQYIVIVKWLSGLILWNGMTSLMPS